jgi:hypothetical protein
MKFEEYVELCKDKIDSLLNTTLSLEESHKLAHELTIYVESKRSKYAQRLCVRKMK